MNEKCDVRDVCFPYHATYGQDVYAPRWCHGKKWGECEVRKTINRDPEFIEEMRGLETDRERQDALLHNYPKKGVEPYSFLLKSIGINQSCE